MKSKKILSLILAVVFTLMTVASSFGFIANAVNYTSTVLSQMVNNAGYYRQDRYTEDSYANYAALKTAAETAAGQSLSQDQIDAAVAGYAAGVGGLKLKSQANTPSGLYLIAPSTVLSGQTYELAFRDAMSAEVTGITCTAENAQVGSFALDGGLYKATVTVNGSTGSVVKVSVNYTCRGELFSFNAVTLISGSGASSVDKTALGAKIAWELGLNRQARYYDSGFTTYSKVLVNSTVVYENPSSTETMVERAIENIDLAVASLTTNRADYSEIYELTAYVATLNPDDYNSFLEVEDALAYIVYDLPKEDQASVDNYADNLRNAINNLDLKVARYVVKCVDTSGNTLLADQSYDGQRTYVVRVPAPAIAGFEPDEAYKMVELVDDYNDVIFTYSPKEYIVSFDARGGICDVATKTLSFGEPYGELPVCTRPGFSFLGWYTNVAGGDRVIADDIVTVNYAEILYAKWSDIEHYTIRFNSQGGTECESITDNYNSEIELPVPYLYGYEFVGWFEDAAGTVAFGYDRMPDVGDNGTIKDVYAKWVKRTYNINLDPGENGTVDPATVSVTYDSNYGVLPTPVKEGHTFAGWYTLPGNDGTAVTATTTVTEENTHTLYAHYTVNTYTLYFDMDGGDPIEPITQDYGTPIVFENEPSKEYYLFAGWKTEDGEEYELTGMPAGNITLTAVWTLNTKFEMFLDLYKLDGTTKIPARNLVEGETIYADVSIKTNYPAGQTTVAIITDKRVFAVGGSTIAKFATANKTSEYMSTLSNTNLTGQPNFGVSAWGAVYDEVEELDKNNLQCARVITASNNAAKEPVIISEKTLLFTCSYTVKATTEVTSGLIMIDQRMTASPERANVNRYPTRVNLCKYNESTGGYSVQEQKDLVPDCTSCVYDLPYVTENSDLAAKAGSTTVIDYENGLVYGLAEKLTLASFAADYAEVFGSGTIQCSDTVLHTGSEIQVVYNGIVRATYTVVIYGDIDQNGTADGADAFYAELYTYGMYDLNDLQFKAADVNRDGAVDGTDIDILSDAGLLVATVSQF